MAYADQPYGYHPIHSQPGHSFDDHDAGVVDPSVLGGADMMRSPEDMHPRRTPFADGSAAQSPSESHNWEHQFDRGLAVEPVSAGPSHGFPEDHNGYDPNTPHMQPYGQQMQPQGWMYEHGPRYGPAIAGHGYVPPPPHASFHGPPRQLHRVDSARGSFSISHTGGRFNPPHLDTGFMPAPHIKPETSPFGQQDHMSVAQHEVDSRRALKRIGGNSPIRTSVDAQRRDGIRKKNGRIEIPEERSIERIEELIEVETNEDILRELKQQKRLLRNREAALASRQRKKRHTEDLEVKEKTYNNAMNDLKQRLHASEYERMGYAQGHNILLDEKKSLEQEIQALRDERRDMLMKHNEETATLRKRIQSLEEYDRNAAPAMVAAQSSAGLTEFNVDLECLNLDGPHEWDEFILNNDLQMDASDEVSFAPNAVQPAKPLPAPTKPDSTIAATADAPKKMEDSPEQPMTSGFLMFLLLCGAFVTSRSGGSQGPKLPQLTPNDSAGASAVLHNILSDPDASVTYNPSRLLQSSSFEPAPSGLAHASARSRSRLDHLHGRLTTPSKQQEHVAAWSLSPAEYASFSAMDYAVQNDPSTPSSHPEPSRTRYNIAEDFDSHQIEYRKNSKADVYNRNIEQTNIPSNIIAQFREYVEAHNELEARQHQHTHDDMFSTKIENDSI